MTRRGVIFSVLLTLGVALLPLACSFPDFKVASGSPPGDQCDDQLTNGDETDIDCGGNECSHQCMRGAACLVDGDCITASCTDGKCDAGPVDGSCILDPDCLSGVCRNQKCQEPSCTDKTKNGLESDEDCGGACDACGDGDSCLAESDCSSGVCRRGLCQAANCSDSLQNGSETDVDCGRVCATQCDEGEKCNVNADCALDRCAEGTCSANLVTDPGFENGITSWDDWVGGTSTIVTSDVHGGTNALRQDEQAGGRGQFLAAELEASSCYQVCFWAKTKDSNWNGQASVRFTQDSATWECLGPASGANRALWKKYCFAFPTGPAPVTDSTILFWLNASTPAAPNLIDDIALSREVDASACLETMPATSEACVQR